MIRIGRKVEPKITVTSQSSRCTRRHHIRYLPNELFADSRSHTLNGHYRNVGPTLKIEYVLFPTIDFPFKSEFFIALALDHKTKDITTIPNRILFTIMPEIVSGHPTVFGVP